MRGVRIGLVRGRDGAYYVERNKYAPWGRGVRAITSPRPAPYVWRHGNGKLDKPA
jgi:hypothetical protein